MKRNRMMRIASFLLIAVLATTCAISGTFAKYTEEFEATSSARVAKWDINFKNASTDAETAFAFDLFATVNDTLSPSDDETDVADGCIAPGTMGSFAIKIVNDSEVNVKYSLVLAQEAKDTTDATHVIPIQYCLTNSNDDADWKSAAEFSAITEVALNMNQTGTITVYWRWVYDGDHTSLGQASNTSAITVTTTATLTATQVD